MLAKIRAISPTLMDTDAFMLVPEVSIETV
jgi:hypothetical protein